MAKEINGNCGPTLKEFFGKTEEPAYKQKIDAIRSEVESFALNYPMPGLDDW